MIMIILLIATVLIICLIKYFKIFRKRVNYFENQKILILGGTSGLGSSIAELLIKKGALVTVASRNPGKCSLICEKMAVDITDANCFQKRPTDYKYIFCCVGYAHPGYFKDLNPLIYKEQIDSNYLGTVNALYHFFEYNERPFTYIMVASTICFLTFPGYSAYAPSKYALLGFYESVKLEMKKNGVRLVICFPSTMNTPGFIRENKKKPLFTTRIEGLSGIKPIVIANKILNDLNSQSMIFTDLSTRILSLGIKFSRFTDLLLMPFSFFAWLLINQTISLIYLIFY